MGDRDEEMGDFDPNEQLVLDQEFLDENEVLKVIPLDEYLAGNTDLGLDDDADVDDDQQSTSNCDGMEEREEIRDDSVCAIQAHEKDCFCVAIAEERWLVSGGEDDVAFLWDLSISQDQPQMKIQHVDSVTQVSFNSTSSLLATADMSGKIIITQLSDLQTRAEVDDCSDLEWMFWHKTSDILFAGGKDGMVWMWLISSTGIAQSKVYAGGNGVACTTGCLLPDGRRLMSGYADGTVRLWQLKDQTSSLFTVDAPVSALHHHVTAPICAVGTEKGTVILLNTGGDTLKRLISFVPLIETKPDPEQDEEESVENCVECLELCQSHQWLAVGRNDGSLCVYELDSSIPRFMFRSPTNVAITRAMWSVEQGAPILVTGSCDGGIRVFDARNGSVAKELSQAGDEVLDLIVLQNNPCRLMTACGGGAIRIFHVNEE